MVVADEGKDVWRIADITSPIVSGGTSEDSRNGTIVSSKLSLLSSERSISDIIEPRYEDISSSIPGDIAAIRLVAVVESI